MKLFSLFPEPLIHFACKWPSTSKRKYSHFTSPGASSKTRCEKFRQLCRPNKMRPIIIRGRGQNHHGCLGVDVANGVGCSCSISVVRTTFAAHQENPFPYTKGPSEKRVPKGRVPE